MESTLAGISLVIAATTGLIAALFVGYVSVRQLPQVHKLVNKNLEVQTSLNAELRIEIAALKDAALTKAEAREAPPPPPRFGG